MTDLFGLVLAGGKSSRMGNDKSLLPFHTQPQRDFLFELLSSFCGKVYTSCRSDQRVPAHLNPIVDQFIIDSPLNGILSAFDLYPDQAWLSIPVDMPYLGREAVQFLIQNRNSTRMATCFYDSEGVQLEPLFTIWEKASFPLLQSFYQSGGVSPREFLKKHPTQLLQIPDAKMLMNVNTEEEWQKWKDANSRG